MRGGEEVKISKRAGSYVTVRDLIDEVGRDAVRYFFLMRKGDSQLVFDVDVARSQSDENPVYYIQMAHARVSRDLSRRRDRRGDRSPASTSISRCSTLPEEQELIKALLDFPVARRRRGRGARAAPRRDVPARHGRQDSSLVSQGARAERAGADHARASGAGARGADRASQRARAARHHGAGANVSLWAVQRWACRDHSHLPSHTRIRRCTSTYSSSMTVLVVGSVALDSVETPFGKADNVLGGSGNFFSASASHLAPVQLVGVIGERLSDRRAQSTFANRADRPRRTRARGRARRSAGADATATI